MVTCFKCFAKLTPVLPSLFHSPLTLISSATSTSVKSEWVFSEFSKNSLTYAQLCLSSGMSATQDNLLNTVRPMYVTSRHFIFPLHHPKKLDDSDQVCLTRYICSPRTSPVLKSSQVPSSWHSSHSSSHDMMLFTWHRRFFAVTGVRHKSSKSWHYVLCASSHF